MTKAIAVQCKATSKSTGKRCKAKAIRGGDVCRHHGGAARQVKANAALKADVLDWGLGDVAMDPSVTLLRLVTQSYRRAEMYAEELKALVDETGLRDALVMEKWSATEQGELYKVGEEIRGLARLEADERERCARSQPRPSPQDSSRNRPTSHSFKASCWLLRFSPRLSLTLCAGH